MAIRNDDMGGTDWSDGEILLAADLNDTISKGYLEGGRWLESGLMSPLVGQDIEQIAPLTATTWLALLDNSTDNCRRTTDAGATWATITMGYVTAPRRIAVCRSDPTRVIIGGGASDSSETAISIDSGATFTAANTEGACDIDAGDIIFLTPTLALAVGGTGGRIQIATISGTTMDWAYSTTFDGSGPGTAYSMGMYDTSTGYAIISTGVIYKTTDGGDNWTTTTHTSPYARAYAVSINPISATVCIIGTDNGAIEYYDNAVGTPVVKVDSGAAQSGFKCGGCFTATNGNIYTLFMGTDGPFGLCIYRSTDSGVTWYSTTYIQKESLNSGNVGANNHTFVELGTTDKLLFIAPRREIVMLDES